MKYLDLSRRSRPLGFIVVSLAIGLLSAFAHEPTRRAHEASLDPTVKREVSLDFLATRSGLAPQYLTNILVFEDQLDQALRATVNHTNRNIALRAMQLICLISPPEDIEPFLLESQRFEGDRLEDAKARMLFATVLASAAQHPFSHAEWQHFDLCLSMKFGDNAFLAALESILLKGSVEDVQQLKQRLQELSGRQQLQREDRNLIVRAIKIRDSGFMLSPRPDLSKAAKAMMSSLSRLYRVQVGLHRTTYNLNRSKALVFFAVERRHAVFYVACFQRRDNAWQFLGVRQWAIS